MHKPRPPFDEPLTAEPVDGEVAILGPAHLHGSMTPEAARASAERLREVADAATRQGGASNDDGA